VKGRFGLLSQAVTYYYLPYHLKVEPITICS